MIICLSPAFAEMHVEALSAYRHAIGNLLRAHAAGWHTFVPDRATCEIIGRPGFLLENQRRFLESAIRSKLATLLGQARSSVRQVLAYPDEEPILEIDERQIAVPLKRFEDFDCCLQAELLTENAGNDGELYVRFAEHASAGSRIHLKLRLLNGGGDTLAAELVRNAGACPPRLGLVDSDQKFPGGPLGQTARTAVDALANAADPLISLKLTHGRTIENYLCAEVASEIYDDAHAIERRDAQLLLVERENETRAPGERSMSLHVSWKKGVKFGDLRKCPQPFRARLEIYVTELGGSVDLAADNDPTQDNVLVVPRACSNLIQRTRTIAGNDPRRFELLYKSAANDKIHGPDLKEISEMVLAYGIAPLRSSEPVA